MYKIIALDVDGTITGYRTLITPHNKQVLQKLIEKYHCVILSAGTCKRIFDQLDHMPIDIVGNYGMQESIIHNGEFTITHNHVVAVDTISIKKRVELLRQKYGFTKYTGDSIVFHLTGMIAIALIGTQATQEEKLSFDPTKQIRQGIYDEVCQLFPEFNVYIGGSSSFDLVQKNDNKYTALLHYCLEHGYNIKDALFVGDDFTRGGNDEHIKLNGLDYLEIDDYNNFETILKQNNIL